MKNAVKTTDAALTWEHLGITITFNPPHANFLATAAGKNLRASSLDAMKAQIEKLNIQKFEAFEAYVPYTHYGKPDPGIIVDKFANFEKTRRGEYDYLVRIQVVGLDKSEGRVRFRYLTPQAQERGIGRIARANSQEEGEINDVLPATPETIKLWRAQQAAEFERDKASAKNEKAIREAKDALEEIEIKASGWRAVKP